MKVVIDASVVIHWLRTGDDSLLAENDISIPTVTIAELFSGASAQTGGSQRPKIVQILKGWKQVKPSTEDAIFAGELRYKYKLSLGDAFVAALAVEQNLPLLTLDSRAFKKIPGLKLRR